VAPPRVGQVEFESWCRPRAQEARGQGSRTNPPILTNQNRDIGRSGPVRQTSTRRLQGVLAISRRRLSDHCPHWGWPVRRRRGASGPSQTRVRV